MRQLDGTRRESQLRRGLRALELVAERPSTPAELGRELGVNRSTALRILQELEASGYVARDRDGKRYAAVAERIYRLAASDHAAVDLSDAVHPMLIALRDETSEAAMFAVPSHGTMVYLLFASSNHPVSVRERIGTVRPMHCSALGKAYLASLDGTALEDELARLDYSGGTGLAAQTADELRSRLALVGTRGFAVDRDETFDGVTCVAAPVQVGGVVVGAAGITGPSTRFPAQRIQEVGELLVAHLDRVRGEFG